MVRRFVAGIVALAAAASRQALVPLPSGAALALVACSSAPPPVAATVDLIIPPIGAASAASAPPPAGASRAKGCSVALSAERVQMSSPTCYLDQHVEDGGVLHYPCTGDGPVEAVFADKLLYRGELRGGEVELEARTELDWDQDACRWGTLGTIRGTLLGGGQLAKQKLQWTYADRVIRGTGCSAACRASTTFDVHD